MKVLTPVPAFLLLIFSWALGLAVEDPNVEAGPVMHEAVAPTEQAEQPAGVAEALPLYRAAPARLQEMVQQFASSRAATPLVRGERLALRLDAAMAETEPSAQQETPVAGEQGVASDACAHRFERILRGESRCGIGLGEDDRIYLDGVAVGEPIVGWGRPNELFVFPASPGGRYRVVDACGDMCGRALVVDVQHDSVQDAFAGRYGPEKDWIGWSPDGAYAALAYEDEGFTWLYVIRTSDGASWEVLNEGLVVRPESLRWLDGGTFEVRAVSCRAGLLACGAAIESSATGDLVRVTVANGPEVDAP